MVASWALLRRERLYSSHLAALSAAERGGDSIALLNSERFADPPGAEWLQLLCRHIPDRYEKIFTPIRRRAP